MYGWAVCFTFDNRTICICHCKRLCVLNANGNYRYKAEKGRGGERARAGEGENNTTSQIIDLIISNSYGVFEAPRPFKVIACKNKIRLFLAE